MKVIGNAKRKGGKEEGKECVRNERRETKTDVKKYEV